MLSLSDILHLAVEHLRQELENLDKVTKGMLKIQLQKVLVQPLSAIAQVETQEAKGEEVEEVEEATVSEAEEEDVASKELRQEQLELEIENAKRKLQSGAQEKLDLLLNQLLKERL